MALHTAISLCTGVGMLDHGVSLAYEATGRTLVPLLYVEKEAFRAANLVWQMEQGILAPAPIWSDVRTCADRECSDRLLLTRGRAVAFPVDILFGGIPCQPWSQAGKRAGHDDDRDLWPATLRAIEVYQPRRVFVENVAGHAARGGTERVLTDLWGMDYRATPGCFTSAETGGGFKGLRVFILGETNRKGVNREGIPILWWQQIEAGADANGSGLDLSSQHYTPDRGNVLYREASGCKPSQKPAIESEVVRAPDGLAGWYNEVSAIGDGVDPLAAAYAYLSLEACLC